MSVGENPANVYQEMVRLEKELVEGMDRSHADEPQDSKSMLAQKVCMLGRLVGHRIPRTPKDLDQCLLKRKEISKLRNIQNERVTP